MSHAQAALRVRAPAPSPRLPLGEILVGDCIEGMSALPAESVDLIFADPPYNLSGNGLKWKGNKTGGDWYMVNETWDRMDTVDYRGFTHDWLSAAHRLLRPTGSIYVCGTVHNLGPLMISLEDLGFKALNIITWYKSNAMPSMTRRSFTHACEYLLYFSRGPGWTFNYEAMKEANPERRKDGGLKQMRDLWTFPVCQGKERLSREDGRALHPTQKPQALVDRVIQASTRPGDVVLDPFMGSGTTAVAAQTHGRQWIGFERHRPYAEAARERVAAAMRR